MSALSLAFIGLAVLLAALVSGVFGLAGGMVLLGALLVFFDVPTAMVLFSVLAAAANFWRVATWWRYIHWRIWSGYVVGGTVAMLLLRLIEFVPSKAMVYFMLGVLPFLIEALPKHWHPSIDWRGVPVLGGLVTTTLQLVAGNGGIFLDVFFQKSTIDRRTTVATKAFCQTFANTARILYFGTVAGIDPSFPLWTLVPMMLLSIGGTVLATFILNRMTDVGFRKWTRVVIFTVSAIYLARAGWLFWTDA
jgi:uncharacterized protein